MKKIWFAFFMLSSCVLVSQNLLDTSSWQVGQNVPVGFLNKGSATENIMEMGIGPKGNNVVLWKAMPDGNSDSAGDGGYDSSYVPIDHTKSYRISVWIKKTNSNDGTTYFGLYSKDNNLAHTTLNLSGALIGNAYFWYGDLPQLDKWYLLVGYIHHSGYSLTTKTGGIYDGVTGAKILSFNEEFKFKPEAKNLANRAYLFYDPNINDRQFFYEPRIDVVNGTEPTIENLIADGGGNTNTGSLWTEGGGNIFYNKNGNVGIGTTLPDSKLTVKGKIHAEEVKIDLNVPAPDYVFTKEYNLLSIEEVKKHIKEKGHLPNIPSAKEMETNGVKLGRMSMRLLEKIEELTLYIIAQEKALQNQQKINRSLEERLKLLENKIHN